MKPDGELAFQHTEDGVTIRVRVEVTYNRDYPNEPLSGEYGTAPLGFLSPQLKASVNSYFEAVKAKRQNRAQQPTEDGPTVAEAIEAVRAELSTFMAEMEVKNRELDEVEANLRRNPTQEVHPTLAEVIQGILADLRPQVAALEASEQDLRRVQANFSRWLADRKARHD